MLGLITVTALLGLGSVTTAHADWAPALVESNSGTSYEPLEDIYVFLPDTMPLETFDSIALLLDGIDLSEVVNVQAVDGGHVVIVSHAEPLAAGDHELQLLEYTDTGDINQRGEWNVRVLGDGHTVDSTDSDAADAKYFFASSFVLEGSYRLAEDTSNNEFDKANAQGSLSINAGTVGERIQTELAASFLYDSRGVQTEGLSEDQAADFNGGAEPRREVEIAEYLLSARSPNLSAMVGHHEPATRGLLVRDFNRRGVSLTAQTKAQALVASGFTYCTEPVSGFRYGAGVGDREHRVTGGVVTLNPMRGNPQALSVSTTYLDAQGEDNSGVGLGGNRTLSSGMGKSVVIDSHTFDQKLQLRAERAETEFDRDGSGINATSKDGEATSFLGLFHINSEQSNDKPPLSWQIGYETREVDLTFRSLANPSLPFDHKLSRIFSVFQRGGLALQLELAREQDNIDNKPGYATLRNDAVSLSMNYSPTIGVDDEGQRQRHWYGQPTFSLASQYSDQSHVQLPSALSDTRVDRQLNNTQLGAAFQYDNWYWGVNHSYALEKDFGDFAQQLRHELTDLSAQMLLGDSFQISAQAQYNSIIDRATRDGQRSWLTSIDTRMAFLDQRLTASLNLSVSEDAAKDNSIATQTRTLGLRIDWILRNPRDNLPGWSLWLQGERQEVDDDLQPALNQSVYQVFLGAKLNWPTTVPKR
jgi:hypothetical protein